VHTPHSGGVPPLCGGSVMLPLCGGVGSSNHPSGGPPLEGVLVGGVVWSELVALWRGARIFPKYYRNSVAIGRS